jgi:hypothetical protein
LIAPTAVSQSSRSVGLFNRASRSGPYGDVVEWLLFAAAQAEFTTAKGAKRATAEVAKNAIDRIHLRERGLAV